MCKVKSILSVFILVFPIMIFSDEVVVKDGTLALTENEIKMAIKTWPEKVLKETKENKTYRQTMLDTLLKNKKIANEFDKISESDSPEFYWKSRFILRNLKEELYSKHMLESIKYPDFTELAREMNRTDKEAYSKTAEQRTSSHILILCKKNECDDANEKRKKADKILSELRAGANFEELVLKYSEDPISKQRKGKIDSWVALDNKSFVKPYLTGLFSIAKKGEYSEVVRSEFGFHIIRLDGIEKERYREFDEVKDEIIAILKEHYKNMYTDALSVKFWPSVKTEYNLSMLDDIFKSSVLKSKKNSKQH